MQGRVAVGLALAAVIVCSVAGCGDSGRARIRAARERKSMEETRAREESSRLAREARAAVDLVEVPAGRGKVGDRSFGGLPEREVEVKAFRIGRYEVSNAEYESFVLATEAIPPADWEHGRCPEDRRKHPVAVPYVDAVRYAEWLGCRLPTKEEWEIAARGFDGRTYPWGDDFDPTRCNSKASGIGDTVPVDSYPEGQSPFGCYNMAGNVKEWTSDAAPDGSRRILKGGCYADVARWVRPAFESTARETVSRNPSLGLRLAKDAE